MKIRINKPDNLDEFPGWVPPMNRFSGVVVDSSKFVKDRAAGVSCYDYEGWFFSSSWLSVVAPDDD